MKRTLFLSALLAACFSHAYAATYTNLTEKWCDEKNNVIYDGKGYFAVESAGNTSVELTISLSSLVSYVNSNDYKSGGYMLLWDDNAADYGLADNADTSVDNGSREPYISGYWAGAAWNASTNNILYSELNQYAVNDSLTLYITNSSTAGVVVSAKNTAGESVDIYTADTLKSGSNTVTNGYYVNLNYVTGVTLNTTSTLDTGSYVPPVDYSEPFVSQRTDGTTVGRVTFLGDSITHGVNDQSYRWQFFKILTDNGIENEIVGPREGYYSTPGHTEDAGSSYGGAEFANVHLAQASGRTHNIISGSTSATVNGTSYGSGVNYGGHSTASTAESFDSNTWFCMMGTNDLLSDTPNSGPTTDQYVAQMQKMLGGTVSYDSDNDTYNWVAGDSWGSMATIVSDVCNEGDTFYMLSITPWGNHSNHNRDMDHYAALEFNRNLAAWTEAYAEQTGKNVVYVDVTRGMVDPTSSNRFMGHDAFFNSSSDRLHPNDQGSILMAGNLAQAMGIGGRTAGLQRMGTTSWSGATVGTNGTVAAGEAYLYGENAFTMEGGYTVDFSADFGDGAANGWSSADNALSISLGDGTNSGTLNLSEGYIMWGSDVLFCWDNSTLAEEGNIRIAWHNGNTTDNVLSGYYVWLGDMLIGQGLNATEGQGLNGIIISASGANGTVNNLTWTDTAYAPTTEGMVSTENAYLTQQDAAAVSGHVSNTMTPMPITLRVNTADTSGVDYSATTGTAATSGAYLVTDTASDTKTIKLTSAVNWVGMTNCEHSGDINVQATGQIVNTIFGAMNGAKAGKLTLEITDGVQIGGGTYSGQTAAIAGAYGGGKADSFNLFVHGGLVGGDIVGGTVNNGCDIKSVNLTINNGTVNGSIIGGSKTAKGTVGTAAIVINGGTITGNINAGGDAGTIGDTSVTIKGGIINGNIVKGSATRTAGAQTTVTVEGNKAKIGANNNGSITADTVTFRNVSDSSYYDGFDKYSGSVKADKLVLDNVSVDVMATLTVEAIEVVNGSSTSVILGDTANLATLTLDSDTVFGAFKAAEARTADTASETTISVGTLTAGTGATLNANLKFSADSTLNLAGSLAMGSSVELASGMTLGLSPEMLEKLYSGVSLELFTGVDSLKLDGETITAGTTLPADDIFSGLSADYTYEMGFNGGVVSLSATMVPEPTTATLSLLALAALAARRRRR